VDAYPYQVRRANLEDLPVLKALWSVNHLPSLELEKHLTEFQLVLRPDGVALGTVALRIAGVHGLVHSEAYYSAAQAAECQTQLWARLQSLAHNRGLARLWLRAPPSAPWLARGFHPATDQDLQRLPAAWVDPRAKWATLSLRDEALLSGALEEEWEQFRDAERTSRDRLQRQAALLKWLAALIALAFFAGALLLLFSVGAGARNSRGPAPQQVTPQVTPP